jgi:hypothetical protein
LREYLDNTVKTPEGIEMLSRLPPFANHFTIGPAILWSPFLLAAHAMVLVARTFGAQVAADGFSSPYWLAMP